MAVKWLADGSMVCTGNADPNRTSTFSPPYCGTAQIASLIAFFSGDQIQPTDNSPEALRAAIPTAATSAPPAIMDSSLQGSVMRYAMENHTHASKVRKQIVSSVSTATYTWTYSSAFGSGVVPIVQGIVQDPSNTAVDSYNVQIIGTPTNTQAQFRIVRITTALGILGLNASPGTINLHLLALEP